MTRFPTLRSLDRRSRRATIAVLAVALAVAGTAAAVTTRANVAPSNTALPTTGGVNAVGSTLTANPGTWNGTAPITFQYAWQICGANGEACHDITGATSQTYVLKADDAGNTVRVRVTGTNTDGSASATSAPSARIAAAAPGPVNTAPPSVSGTAATGSTLTANPGTWTGAAPITFTYQWTVCGVNGEACHDITGATNNTYVLKTDDAGNTVRVRVAARNTAGTTTATSAASARITSQSQSPGCPAGSANQTVDIGAVTTPARLVVAKFQVTSGALTLSTRTFTARFQVTDTCGRAVSGALVYPAAVPYNQFTIPTETATDATGWVSMTFNRKANYPASSKQQQLTMFVRTRKAGEPPLQGVSTSRLIAFAIKR